MNSHVNLRVKSCDPGSPDVPTFLSQAGCRAIIAEIHTLGLTQDRVDVVSQWRGDVRWARNRISVASDWRDNSAGFGDVGTNQIDLASLQALTQSVQRVQQGFPPTTSRFVLRRFAWQDVPQEYPKTHIWSDQTYTQTPAERAALASQLIGGAERTGMMSAGYLSVEARGTALYTNDNAFLYAPQTLAQCSITVRDPHGMGSGWAGASSYAWDRIDAATLAEIALDKCLRSRNPVRIEPGRYTLIMEPQATFELMKPIMRSDSDMIMGRASNEDVVFSLPFMAKRLINSHTGAYDITKLGERVMDDRITIAFDPLDPDLGVLPFDPRNGDPHVPVTWIDKGVLTTLSYDRAYAVRVLKAPAGKPNSGAFRMSGGTTTIEEMIATTKRGLLVTRFWDVECIHPPSLLCSGLTRDGLWLVENGKISHPVTNLHFTESPLFAFNNVEQLGVPVPVFSPECPAIVPPVKVRDFTFTSLIDAI